MIITSDNINALPKDEQGLATSLLSDLDELNLGNDWDIKISWQEYHDDISPECLEPQDHYGEYRLIDKTGDSIGCEMSIHELDTVMCALIGFKEEYLQH